MSYENPTSFLFDTKGIELAVSASQQLTGSGAQPGLLMAGSGSDGVVRFFKVSDSGEMHVTGTIATTTVANTPVSQGNPGGITDAWHIKITDGSQVIGDDITSPLWVSGAVTVNNFPEIQTITGSVAVHGGVSVNNFPAVQTITGSVTVNGPQGNVSDPYWVTGSVYATQESNPTATVASVASSATVTTLLAANGSRRAAIIFNDSTKRLYVKLGSGAALGDYTIKMSAQGYWEVPGFYTGIITGIWESANGSASVTEVID